LPEFYVEDESLRINLYRRLASYQEFSQIEQFEKELLDRFGALPVEAVRLLDAARLRMMGERLGLKKLVLEVRQLKMFFNEQWADRFPTQEHFSERLRSIIKTAGVPVQFLQKGGFGIKAQLSDTDTLSAAKKVLQSLG
jgi:transcription-repair coupling factor (superfamily II helicase)